MSLPHVSRLTSHVSRLTSHVSRLTSHVSRLTSHVKLCLTAFLTLFSFLVRGQPILETLDNPPTLEEYLKQRDSMAEQIMQKYPNLVYHREILVEQGKVYEGQKPEDASPYTLIEETFDYTPRGERTSQTEENSTAMEELLGSTNNTPAVFIIRGGGYLLLNDQMAGVGTNVNNTNMDVMTYLNNLNNGQDYKAFLVTYYVAKTILDQVSPPQSNLQWAQALNDLFTINDPSTPPESYCSFQKHSIRAFYDLRKVVDAKINSTAKFDRNKMIFIGHSAGAQLALNYLFWDEAEIPTTLNGMFGPCFSTGFGWLGGGTGPNIPTQWRTDYWNHQYRPLGVMAMSAFTSWPDIYDNNDFENIYADATHEGVPIYILHGTKDRLVNQDTGRAPYRITEGADEYTNSSTYNYVNEYYPKMYGSKWLYKQLYYKPARLRFDQVCFGCHDIMQIITGQGGSGVDPYGWGTWNYTNISGNIVLDKIMEFLTQVTSNTFPTAYQSTDPLFPVKGLGSFYPDKLNGQGNMGVTDSTFISPITSVFMGCENGVRKARIIGGGDGGLFYYWRFNTCPTCNNGTWFRTLGNEWLIPSGFGGGANATLQVQAINGCFTGQPYRFTQFLPTAASCPPARLASDVEQQTLSTEISPTYFLVNTDGNQQLSSPVLVCVAKTNHQPQIQVVDNQGKVVWQATLNIAEGYGQYPLLDMTGMASGIYHINLTNGEQPFQTSFIKP